MGYWAHNFTSSILVKLPNHMPHKEHLSGIFIDRTPRLSMEEILRRKAGNSKRYELKEELSGSEIKELMKHTRLYHESAFNSIRHSALSVKSRMKRLDIFDKGYYELKYSNKNIDILIYQCITPVSREPSELIRVNNQKKKVYGTNNKLIARVFQDYIK